MEKELMELLVGITDSIENLASEASKIVDTMGILATKVVELRTDVDKLIENQTGGHK